MEEDLSNDVVAIYSDDEEPTLNKTSDKPIIQLFKRLLNSDNKQSTVLTNAQIVDILDKEFNINLWDLHELEGEIYLTIMKKYLKDWPQWDEFDRFVNNSKLKNDTNMLQGMLKNNYGNLKEYLKVMLDRAQILAKGTVKKIIGDNASNETVNNDKSDSVVLEVHSTRNQLNELFFRRPHPSLNNTIFNGENIEPTQIKLDTLPIEAILNWWNVKITISFKGSGTFYERKTIHQLSHMLVNKNLLSRYRPLKVLPQTFQINTSSKTDKTSTLTVNQYLAVVELLQSNSPGLEGLYDFIKLDLKLIPFKVRSRLLYRRYTNKYPYIRYLYKDVKNPDINSRKYDLQLEETVSPKYELYLGHVHSHSSDATLEVECMHCFKKFIGLNMIEELKGHFNECHINEPDWKCTNCNKVFPMALLAQKWWTHKC